MRPQLRRTAPVLVFTLLVALTSAMPGSGATRSSGLRIGTPWTGAAGIQSTTRAIMQRPQSHAPTRALPEPEAKLHLTQNPNARPASGAKTLGLALTGPKLAVGTSFTGGTLAQEQSAGGGFVPPDTMGAVGPTQFLVTLNGMVKVFSKTGTVGSLNTDLNTFFASVLTTPPSGGETDTTDPHVRYDKLSGRWIVTCIDLTFDSVGNVQENNRVLIAVSDNATISNSTVWTFFQFQQNLASTTGDNNDFADYDTLGIDANAIYMGANMFDASNNYVSSSVFIIRKSSVMGAGPIVVTAFRDVVDETTGAGPFTPQGADNDDPAATEGYYVGHDDQFFGRLDVLRVGTPGGTPTLSAPMVIDTPASLPDSFALGVPSSGSTKNLDGGDIRLADASIRNGKLYTAEAVAVNSSGTDSGTLDRDASNWFEISSLSTTPTLSRSGTVFDSSGSVASYWMPSISVSPQGHAVMGMSASSSTTHANAAYSSMLNGTSTFSAPTTYTAASASYNVDTGDSTYRWGDFSHTGVDPCDGQTFWTIQEYIDGTNSWGVKVAKIMAPPPATPASTSPTSVGAGLSSVSVTLTGTSTSGSGFWDPGSGTCRIAASVSGGVTVNSVTYTDPTHVTLDLNTVGASGGAHTVTITNPDGQQASASVLTITSPPANTALPTITGTAAIGNTLTEHDGTWSGYPAPTLTYQWKRCDSAGANCSDIASATNNTYVIAAGDAGYRIRVTVTGTNASGFASADSATADVTGPTTNLAPPTITGTAQAGSVLTAQSGSWTGVPAPTFSYQWERCDPAGATCLDIPSATASTYTAADADVGSTIRVEVTADNGGGPVGPVESAATPAVVAAPPTGGGGGGGSSPPDVVASISASPANPGVGSTLTYTVQASILSGNATDVVATINLPTQVTFVSASADRGSGCTGTTTLTCDLNLLNGTLVATVQVVTQVTQAGTLVATASMTTTPGDANTANNTATSTITVSAPPPPPPPPPVLPAPVLKRVGTAPLVGVRHTRSETLDARFHANEVLHLSATVTALRSTKKLSLLKSSRLAGSTAASSRLVLRGTTHGSGTYALHLVFGRNELTHKHVYVADLVAVNAKGKRTTIRLRFTA